MSRSKAELDLRSRPRRGPRDGTGLTLLHPLASAHSTTTPIRSDRCGRRKARNSRADWQAKTRRFRKLTTPSPETYPRLYPKAGAFALIGPLHFSTVVTGHTSGLFPAGRPALHAGRQGISPERE